MPDTCYITETAQGYALHFSDGSTPIDGQATYADAAKLARLNGYAVVPPPATALHLDVALRGRPIFRVSGPAGFVAEDLRRFCLQHGGLL